MYCNVLQYATVCCSVCCTCEWGRVFQCNAVCRNAMQCLAVCLVLRVLQCVLHLWMRILAPPKAVRFSCWVPWPNLSLTSTSSPRQETLKRNLPKRCLETKRALQIWLFFFVTSNNNQRDMQKRPSKKLTKRRRHTLFPDVWKTWDFLPNLLPTTRFNFGFPHPPKNGEIALWPSTRAVKCKYYVSQKRNVFNNKIQLFNIILTRIF